MSVEKILLIQTAFLGDVVFTTALLNGLRRLYPGARITLLASPRGGDILRGQPGVDEVILYDKKGVERGPSSLIRLLSRLRGHGFDLVVSPHRSFRSALIARFCGARRRLGFRSGIGRAAFDRGVPFPKEIKVPYRRELRLLQGLGSAADEERRPRLSIDDGDRARARERLTASGVTFLRPLAGFVVGSVWPTKRWPVECFLEAGRLLRAAGVEIAVFGGPAEAEEGSLFNGEEGFANLTGTTDLGELPSLLSCCDVVVAVDTGPLHLAMALGVSVVALFGPTDEEQFEFQPLDRCLTADAECRPCSPHGGKKCPQGDWICMTGIGSDDVAAAVLDILEKGRAQRRAGRPGAGEKERPDRAERVNRQA